MNRDIQELREVVQKLVPLLAGKGLTVTQRGSQAYVQTNPRTRQPELVNIPNIPESADQGFIRAVQGFIDHEVGHVLITDWKYYGRGPTAKELEDPKVQQFQGTHNITEDCMIEKEMAKIFPGSARNISDMRLHFIEKITKKALAGAKDEKERFRYLLVPAMRALSGHTEFQDFMDAGKHWENKWVKELVTSLKPATVDLLRRATTTKETLEVAEELHLILFPPKPPAPEPKKAEPPAPQPPKPEPKKEDPKPEPEEEPAEDEDDGDEPAEPKKYPAPKKEPEPEPEPEEDDADTEEDDDEADTDPEDEDEPADPVDDEDEDEDELPPAGPGDGDDPRDHEDEGDDEGEGDAPPPAPAPEPEEEEDTEDEEPAEAEADDEPAGGSAGDDEGDDDLEGLMGGDMPPLTTEGAEGGGVGNVDVEDQEGDDGAGGGVGNESGKSIFDFDDDAFEEADMSSQMSILISEEAVLAMHPSQYLVFTREMDQIEHVEVPDMNKKWVPQMEDEVRSMTGRMQKDIERLMASQSHVIRTPGHKRGRLHAPSLYRIGQGDPRVFSQREEHVSKDTAVSLVCDNSGSMKGPKMKLAMTAAYALSSTLDRVKINHEVIGFTTGGWYSTPQVIREAMQKEVENAKIAYDRVEPIIMPIYKEFGERMTATVKARFAYMMFAQHGLNGNIDGESLEYAALRLMKQKEKRKVMIVLSDGQPAGSHKSGPHLSYMVRHLEQHGIEMMGIGIKSDAVKKFYPNNTVLNDIDALPLQVMQELKRILA